MNFTVFSISQLKRLKTFFPPVNIWSIAILKGYNISSTILTAIIYAIAISEVKQLKHLLHNIHYGGYSELPSYKTQIFCPNLPIDNFGDFNLPSYTAEVSPPQYPQWPLL